MDVILKKDIVIPAGTRFSDAPIKTERAKSAKFVEACVGLTKDTCGYFTYPLADDSEHLEEWFSGNTPPAAKYRKKPVVIEAIQYNGTNADEIVRFVGPCIRATDTGISIPTKEGLMECSIGDFVIKGVKGEFYPCKPDIFALTYEPEVDDGKEA